MFANLKSGEMLALVGLILLLVHKVVRRQLVKARKPARGLRLFWLSWGDLVVLFDHPGRADPHVFSEIISPTLINRLKDDCSGRFPLFRQFSNLISRPYSASLPFPHWLVLLTG